MVKPESSEEKKPGKTIDEKLAALKEKVQQLKAQKQRQEARIRAKTTKQERAKDTRKKILVGALVLSKVQRGLWSQAQLLELTQELTRADDRELFGLPPLPAS